MRHAEKPPFLTLTSTLLGRTSVGWFSLCQNSSDGRFLGYTENPTFFDNPDPPPPPSVERQFAASRESPGFGSHCQEDRLHRRQIRPSCGKRDADLVSWVACRAWIVFGADSQWEIPVKE